MGAKRAKFVMIRHGDAWFIKRTGPGRRSWGHAYAEMPTALVDELNGAARPDVLAEINARTLKVKGHLKNGGRG